MANQVQNELKIFVDLLFHSSMDDNAKEIKWNIVAALLDSVDNRISIVEE